MERLKKIITNPGISIKSALKKMDESAAKILFVCDAKGRLLGTVTDGDIRRWILKGNSLSRGVELVMNKNPICLNDGYSRDTARNIMVSGMIECIPVVNNSRVVTSAIWWLDLFESKENKHRPINLPIVIMAGGSGSRLSPFTNILPKPLIPIGDKPIIELIMDKFIDFGCKDIYLSVRYKSNILKAYFQDSSSRYRINYIEESRPLGTIGSLYLLKGKIKSTFLVTNCDILIDADYYDVLKFHKRHKNSITLVVSLKHYTIPYGICQISNGGALKKIREKPEYDFLVNTGSYIMEPEVFKDIPRNEPYQATELIGKYIKKNKKVGVYPVSDKSWVDIGQWEEYQKGLEIFKAR